MNAPLLWFIVGVAFFVAELMTPAMVLLFFGVGTGAYTLLFVLFPAPLLAAARQAVAALIG